MDGARLPERVLRAAAGAGLCAIYFLQNAAFAHVLGSVLRLLLDDLVAGGGKLDDDEDDDAAAVDAGAAASSVLAYLVARSSMSLVCLRCPGRRRRDASTASGARGEETPADAPLEEAVLGVLLRQRRRRRRRPRSLRSNGGGFARRAARGGRRLARGVRAIRGADARAKSAGADAIWNWRPSQLPGGSSCGYAPDAAAKLPTTIAERIRIVAEVCGAKL